MQNVRDTAHAISEKVKGNSREPNRNQINCGFLVLLEITSGVSNEVNKGTSNNATTNKSMVLFFPSLNNKD